MWVTYDAISRGSLTWPAQTIDMPHELCCRRLRLDSSKLQRPNSRLRYVLQTACHSIARLVQQSNLCSRAAAP